MMRRMTSTSREQTAIKNIGVVGLGTMGAGIAEVFARNGYRVVGVEHNDESLERGRQHIEHSTGRAVKRGKLTEAEEKELFDRIELTTELESVKGCDFVIEAIVEQLPLKQDLFRRLDAIVGPDAVLATNTSSLSVTEIGTATARPGRVVGTYEKGVTGLPYILAYAIQALPDGAELIVVLRAIHGARDWPRGKWPD